MMMMATTISDDDNMSEKDTFEAEEKHKDEPQVNGKCEKQSQENEVESIGEIDDQNDADVSSEEYMTDDKDKENKDQKTTEVSKVEVALKEEALKAEQIVGD